MTDWVPVVDVSEHQGSIDFAMMRAAGVHGVILRATHGLTVDKQLARNATLAKAEFGRNVGYYEFCNPKRGTPQQCADALVAAVNKAHGDLDTFLMLDIEGYMNESPNLGTIVPPTEYAVWLREHIKALRTVVSSDRLIGYTNRAYWDVGVRDPQLAGELDWIGARYPAYSFEAYVKHPLPASPAGWHEWAFDRATGPVMPTGADGWEGWQFSAGYNGQGTRYGCGSRDLDLNIVHPGAWQRWTGAVRLPDTPDVTQPLPDPPQEDEDMRIPTNSQQRIAPDGQSYGPNVFVHVVDPSTGNLRYVEGAEGRLYDGLPRVAYSNEELDAWLERSTHGGPAPSVFQFSGSATVQS